MSTLRNPLRQAGVKEGEFLLAVNRVPLTMDRDPWAAMQGLAGQTVVLTVSKEPKSGKDDRDVVVTLLGSDMELRYRQWIEKNRKYVEEKTGGRVGYVYVPDTGMNGQNDLYRQLYGQINKEALIIDDRWNGGGQIPTRFIELLNRPVTNYWARRDGRDMTWPPDAHHGPKCMLINGLAGSGRRHVPRARSGRRTSASSSAGAPGAAWSGISGNPGLIDGSGVTAPTFAYYEKDGTWGIEGHGVDPDIDVIDDPARLANGEEPQLDAAISHILGELNGASLHGARAARLSGSQRVRHQAGGQVAAAYGPRGGASMMHAFVRRRHPACRGWQLDGERCRPMLEKLQMAPPDPILGLGEAFKNDPRPHKINLSVGVYQDADGKTPMLGVVKEAEQRLLAQETNKSYLSIDGLPEYGRHVRELLFGAEHEIVGAAARRDGPDAGRHRGACAWRPTSSSRSSRAGASGSVVPPGSIIPASSRRPVCRSTRIPTSMRPARAWTSTPSWRRSRPSPPATPSASTLRATIRPGIDPTPEQWRQIGQVLQQRQILPLVDFAYQGFAEGIDEDRAGLLQLVDDLPRDADLQLVLQELRTLQRTRRRPDARGPTEEAAQIGLSHIKICIRTNYSNPPKHGGAIVATILSDPDLRARWLVDVQAMRDRIAGMRQLFVDTLRAKGVDAGLLVHHAPARHVLVFRHHAGTGRQAAQ